MSGRRSSSHAGARARARMLVQQHLGWLRGFPETNGRRWTVIPPLGSERPVERIAVDGRMLAAATRAARTLWREHRGTLDLLFGDGRGWYEATLLVLDGLKPAVHAAASPSDRMQIVRALHRPRVAMLFERVAREQPVLSLMASALSWMHAADGASFRRALLYLESEVSALEELLARRADRRWPGDAPSPLELGLRLVDLALAEGPARVRPLLARVGDPRSFGVPLRGVRGAAASVTARRRGRSQTMPDAPTAQLGSKLVALAARLVGWDAPRRRRALALISLLDPTELVDRWAPWWERYRALAAESEGLLARELTPGSSRRLTHIQRGFEQLEKRMPPALEESALVRAVDSLAGASRATQEALTRTLAAVPARRGREIPRAHLAFAYESGLHDEAGTRLRARELRKLLDRTGDLDVALAPWRIAWAQAPCAPARTLHLGPDFLLAEDDPAAVRAFFAGLLAGYRREGALRMWSDRRRVVLLADFARLTHDGERAERLVAALYEAGERAVAAPTMWLRIALELAERDEEVAPLVRALMDIEVDDDGDEADPLGLARALRDPVAADLVRRALLAGRTRSVRELGGRLRVLRALGAPFVAFEPAGRAPRARWMDRYPKALEPLLCALASVDPRASASTARLLGKSHPDPEQLAREIENIARRLPRASPERAERMRTRIANLERRRAAPASVSPRALEQERHALAELVERRAIGRWQRALDEAVGRALAPALGAEPLPAWALEPIWLELLAHLCALETPSRKLAFRVLSARARPYPWDLRDEPANRAFLQKLARRGIDVAPWLDGIGLFESETPRGLAHLQLERDPLEVLLMGKHFGTCLTPGWFNFFSAVSNAADINKRVVYGRDQDGQVFGRCLLALTDEGHVLTFHPYCHDEAGWGFRQLVRMFVMHLCRRMGSEPAPRGSVSNLLCQLWYDDGPLDVTRSFDWLDPESSGFRRIAEATPEGLLDTLAEVLDPLGVNALTLPLLLGMRPFGERPELAVPLLEVARATRALSLEAKLQAAELAWRAGAVDRVRAFVAGEILDGIERWARPERPVAASAFALLLDLGEASTVLRLLDRTRPRGVRRAADERNGERLFVRARACEMLRRPARALALYRLALGCPLARDTRAKAEARIASLAG